MRHYTSVQILAHASVCPLFVFCVTMLSSQEGITLAASRSADAPGSGFRSALWTRWRGAGVDDQARLESA